MSLIDILNADQFTFPLVNNNGSTFKSFLEKLYSDYIKALRDDKNLFEGLEQFTLTQPEIIEHVERSCDHLLNILDAVRGDNYDNASLLFHIFITKNKNFINTQVVDIEKDKSYFRARKIDSAKVSPANLMAQNYFFHCPFDKVRYVKSTRFASLGSPVLYLSNSVIGAYLETKSTSLENLQVVKFEFSKTIRCLSFLYSNPTKDLPINKYSELYSLKGLLFPLLAACYTKNIDGTAPAPEEYIIPQILSRWNRFENDIDGIKYESTKVNSKNYKKMFYNFIVPPKTTPNTGYCPKLKKDISN